MSDSRLLSIIVPVYNVEQYLAQCLDSILAQDLNSYEVLLINNGSNDNSPVIAKSYVDKWPLVFKYHNLSKNGVSAARNFGIEQAIGDYILFTDSDDCLNAEGLAFLLHEAVDRKLDVVVGNFYHWFDGDKREANNSHFVSSNMSGKEWLKISLSNKYFMPAVWNKVFRRKFILDNNIFFEPDILSAEDLLYTVQSLLEAKKVASVEQKFYLYRYRSGSITNKVDLATAQKRLESHLQVTKNFLGLTKEVAIDLRKLILERTIKLNLVSFQAMYKALGNDLEKMESYFEKIDELELYRYVCLSRFSHLIDLITLKFGFGVYFSWRLRKWKH